MAPAYITKEEMIAKFGHPYFGFTVTKASPAYPETGVWIRSDLPIAVQISVRAHEQKHYDDNAFQDGRVWHWEFRAWVAGFNANPEGFFLGIWMSITDKDRVRLYLQRFKNNF